MVLEKGMRVRWIQSDRPFLQFYLRKVYPYSQMMVMEVKKDEFEPCVTLIGPDGCFLRETWFGSKEPEGFVGRISVFSHQWLEPLE